MATPSALVIGGSLAGLFTANLLRTIGWQVNVFERSRGDLSGRGAGLGMKDELFNVMRRIGIAIDSTLSADVHSHICLDRAGTIVCNIPMPGRTTAWDRIYRLLKYALPGECYHSGKELKRFDQTDKSVTAVFEDGTQFEADLLVGADGMNSTVRRQLLPETNPVYSGYIAWRGVVDAVRVPPVVFSFALQHLLFGFPDGEMALSIPMAATDGLLHEPNRRTMFVWFRPVEFETALPRMCTDASGRAHGISIPPPLVRHELIRELHRQGEALLAPQLAALLRAMSQPILQPIFDLESPRLVFGKVVLVGDAAFVARPHAGTGVTKAALDAQELVDRLSAMQADLAGALDEYDNKRRQFGHRLVAQGRYLGAHLVAGGRPAQGIEAYLREFGANGVIPEGAIDRHLSRCAYPARSGAP